MTKIHTVWDYENARQFSDDDSAYNYAISRLPPPVFELQWKNMIGAYVICVYNARGKRVGYVK